MSKLQASSVRSSVKTVLAQSGEDTYKEAGGKKRNFIETIELQVGLKNYDPQRDKRFVSDMLPRISYLGVLIWYIAGPHADLTMIVRYR